MNRGYTNAGPAVGYMASQRHAGTGYSARNTMEDVPDDMQCLFCFLKKGLIHPSSSKGTKDLRLGILTICGTNSQ